MFSSLPATCSLSSLKKKKNLNKAFALLIIVMNLQIRMFLVVNFFRKLLGNLNVCPPPDILPNAQYFTDLVLSDQIAAQSHSR